MEANKAIYLRDFELDLEDGGSSEWNLYEVRSVEAFEDMLSHYDTKGIDIQEALKRYNKDCTIYGVSGRKFIFNILDIEDLTEKCFNLMAEEQEHIRDLKEAYRILSEYDY